MERFVYASLGTSKNMPMPAYRKYQRTRFDVSENPSSVRRTAHAHELVFFLAYTTVYSDVLALIEWRCCDLAIELIDISKSFLLFYMRVFSSIFDH